MSARSLGRGVCPKCGEEGSVVVKWVGGKEYVYVKHGRTWHYIGPVDKVDIYALLREPTTALPLRAGREVGIAGGSMSGQPRALSKDVVAVVGILLVALGSLIAIGVVAWAFLAPHLMVERVVVSASVTRVFPVTLNRTEVVYAISVLEDPVSVDIAVHGAMFKVLAAPRASLPFTLNATQPDGGGVCFGAVRVCITTVGTEELSGFLHMFSGEYTSYSARLEPGQVLLVWPHKLLARPASMSISMSQSQAIPLPSQRPSSAVSRLMAVVVPGLLIAASLIAGGYLLYKRSKSS